MLWKMVASGGNYQNLQSGGLLLSLLEKLLCHMLSPPCCVPSAHTANSV